MSRQPARFSETGPEIREEFRYFRVICPNRKPWRLPLPLKSTPFGRKATGPRQGPAADDAECYLRKQFRISRAVVSARVFATCDNSFEMWVNGKRVLTGSDWAQPEEKELGDVLGAARDDRDELEGAAAHRVRLAARPRGFRAVRFSSP